MWKRAKGVPSAQQFYFFYIKVHFQLNHFALNVSKLLLIV